MRITQLVASKRRPERVNIHVDGKYHLQVHVDVVMKHGLKKDLEFTPGLAQKLSDDSTRMRVRSYALQYATYKMRTCMQVRKRLMDREFGERDIEDAIAFLIEFGYLNDESFSRMYVRDALLSRAVSSKRLSRDLRSRGVASEVIHRVLEAEFPHDQSLDLARKAATKKLRMVSYKPQEKQRSSVRDYLVRQGFRWEEINVVLAEVFSAETITDEDSNL